MSIPTLEPHLVLGLRTGVHQGVQYITDAEIVYPAGSIIILHNFAVKRQRYIYHGVPKKNTTCMAVSTQKTLIAVADTEEKTKPIISLYNVSNLQLKKVLEAPSDSTAEDIQSMQFTHDSKFLVVILGEPDWTMVYYNVEKGTVESMYKDFNPEKPGPVLEALPNPTDATIVCAVGPGIFRLLGLAENVWRPYGFSKSDKFPLTCSCWLAMDRVLAGTADGHLLLVEFGELKIVYKAADLEVIDLKAKELEEMPANLLLEENSLFLKSEEESEESCIHNLIAFSRGFAFAMGANTVILFEKESAHVYRKRNVFKLVVTTDDEGNTNEEIDPSAVAIQILQISPNENSFLVTSGHPQLYTVELWGPDINTNSEILFTPLGESLHEGPIIALAVCSWKTIFLTCGQADHTIRIWNYATEQLELSKWFQEDSCSASLHPTGLYAVVGFIDKLRFMEILIDELKTLKKFPIRGCKVCSFSNNGHMFAAVDFSLIHVYSSISYELMVVLRGHNGRVTDLSWNSQDTKIVSCGSEGAVYEWDPSTGRRIGEIIEKSCQFSSVCTTSDGNVSYAVGSDGMLKEISQSQITKDLSIMEDEKLTIVVLSRSDQMLFVTGGNGSVMSLEFPLQHKANFKEYNIHNKTVTAMRLTYDDLNLISCSHDGTIIVWRLKNVEGKTAKIDQGLTDFNDILVTKDELEDKNVVVRDLKLRMQELVMEHSYQAEQIGSAHTEKVAEIHSNFSQTIKELKELLEQMEVEHTEEVNNINADIAKMKDDFEATIASLEASFNSKLIIEYDKYSAAQDRKDELEKHFLQQLESLGETKKQAIQELTDRYEEQLHDKQVYIEELLEEASVRVKEHEEIKKQLEDDGDKEILLTKTTYEDKLKEERDTIVRLRGEIGVTKKKFISSQKEIEESKHTIGQLNTELRRFIEITITQENNIFDLKKEIHERDATIQEKESRIYELKRKNQELEKYKFVLTYKIKDLKNQIEPKEREIRELKQKMNEMEDELEGLQKINSSLELQDKELSSNLKATHKELNRESRERKKIDHLLDNLRRDIHNASNLIQEPKQLKDAIKNLYRKYTNMDAAYTNMRKADKDVNEEFMRQREYLERKIVELKKEVDTQSSGKLSEAGHVMEENNKLIAEVNELRTELIDTQTKVRHLQSVLGLSKRYMDSHHAMEKLQKAVKSRAEIRKECEDEMMRLEVMNQQLKEDIKILNAKLDEEEIDKSVEDDKKNLGKTPLRK